MEQVEEKKTKKTKGLFLSKNKKMHLSIISKQPLYVKGIKYSTNIYIQRLQKW